MSAKDEPFLTLPTLQLIGATIAACAVAAGAWAGGAALLGYGGHVVVGGAFGAGLTAVVASVSLALIFPWIAKPASTTMLLWMVADFGGMAVTLGLGYLLYSATFLAPGSGPPLLLGVVLAYFLVMFAKVPVVASHLKAAGLL